MVTSKTPYVKLHEDTVYRNSLSGIIDYLCDVVTTLQVFNLSIWMSEQAVQFRRVLVKTVRPLILPILDFWIVEF